MDGLRISQLAAQSGVKPSTLRFYEQVGLLPAARTQAGYRIYDDRAVQRLRFITAAKNLRLSLDSIRDLLGAWQSESCGTVKSQLRPMISARLTDAEARVAEMIGFRGELLATLERLDDLPDKTGPCDSSCAFLVEPLPDTAVLPIACSLDGSGQTARRAEWRAMLAGCPVSQLDEGVEARLPAERAGELAALVVAEQQCCPFLRFRMCFETPGTVRLEIIGPVAALDLFGELLPSGIPG
jgi:DNA-binding transcriptional MerR regulator